ncbi:hypothetical protein HDZ31DRAFT_83606 [Schizophyllum fasciatum]
MRVEQGFQIPLYEDGNAYTTDPVLRSLLKRVLPEKVFSELEPDFQRLGDEVNTVIRDVHRRGEVNDPTLVQYDQWGRRVDRLQTSEGWRKLKAISQRQGLPAIFYERKHGEYSRIDGFARVLMMAGDMHTIFCPISMTDGCARVIELVGTPAMKKDIFPRLISRDPEQAFTAGQWMTERPGGSDVSQTETRATATGAKSEYGPVYTLDGFKWFSSATDSDVALALGRSGALESGSRGLSLFMVPLRKPLLREPGAVEPSPISNNIFVHRLKNKFGTKALPTAELSLEGAEGYRVGAENQGVKLITPVLNITRVWSAVNSVSALRRSLAIATSYAKVRRIRGGTQLLQDTPLHVAQLAQLNLVYRALAHFAFGVVHLLGKSECGTATEDERYLLRIMTPTVKAFATEKAVPAIADAMAALGGNGYMEENDIARLLRDAMVERIWEGTTTVLSLDLARAMKGDAVRAFSNWANSVLQAISPSLNEKTATEVQFLRACVAELGQCFTGQTSTLVPRPALMLMGCTLSSLFLLQHACWSVSTQQPEADLEEEAVSRWVRESGVEGYLQAVRQSKDDVQRRVAYDHVLVFGRPMTAKL